MITKFIFSFLLFGLGFINIQAELPSKPLSQHDNEMVNSYLEKAEVSKSQNNSSQLADFYNKIAYLYWQNNALKEALLYFSQSLEINKTIGNTNAMQVIYSNIGMIYSEGMMFTDALNNFSKSLQISKHSGRKAETAANLINIALTYQSLKKYEESNINAEAALGISLELGHINLMKNSYSLLAENYQKLGNNEKSYENYDKFAALDKHLKQKQIEQIEEAKNKMQAEKDIKEVELKTTEAYLDATIKKAEKITLEKEMQINLLEKESKLKELALKEEKARNEYVRLIALSAIGGGALIFLVLILMIVGFRSKQKANAKLAAQNDEIIKQQEVIRKKNENITQGINYAQRIQKAMLPPQKTLNNLVSENFILFRPRDIVSGDFFYFTPISSTKNISHVFSKQSQEANTGKYIISAIDCTGHGVPGAFMSLIGYNLLSEIIGMGVTNPEEILNALHTGVRNALKQETTDNKDGMDMALCYIDEKNKTLDYAGARSPLTYFQNGELVQLHGDPLPIGGLEVDDLKRQFKKQTISLDVPTTVYLFSDGYHDQIGGETGKKFMAKRFKDLLTEIHQKPMSEQKDILQENLESWMGDKHTQIDDILVIGLKFNI